MNSRSDQNQRSTEALHTLQILDEVALGKPLTQRALSRKLGIALGMVNSYLKRLARHGYIQVVQAERKRLHYLLTPSGIAEKSALTYRYVRHSYEIFTDVRDQIGAFFDALKGQGVTRIVLYKATVVTEIAVLVLQDSSLDLVAIVDDQAVGTKFLGYQVKPLDSLTQLEYDRVFVTAEESIHRAAEYLGQYGVAHEQICHLG